MLSLQDAEQMHAFVTSRLDYCNVLLSGCTNSALVGRRNSAFKNLYKIGGTDQSLMVPVGFVTTLVTGEVRCVTGIVGIVGRAGY